jgi:hypothetical protein
LWFTASETRSNSVRTFARITGGSICQPNANARAHDLVAVLRARALQDVLSAGSAR